MRYDGEWRRGFPISGFEIALVRECDEERGVVESIVIYEVMACYSFGLGFFG